MHQLSSRTANLHASPIREILAVIDQAGMVSFAGGLPDAASFPDFEVGSMPAKYKQYGPSEGEPELRAAIAAELKQIGLRCNSEQVLILSGSQQGLDLVAKLFIDPGTSIAVESPTYLAALQVFRFFGAQFLDLGSLLANSNQGKPALCYAIPTFQNPTGHCYSADERATLANYCDSHNIPLFEDDPYRDLVYDDCNRSPVCSLLEKSSWIYQGSFSKTLSPGIRLGYLACSDDLLPYLTRLKQAADLHSNRLSQWLALQQMQDSNRLQRMQQLVECYRCKRDYFEQLLMKYFFDLASWETPRGGLFFWLKLNRNMDTKKLLCRSIDKGVAFMPGESFFPQSEHSASYIRLNFSHASTIEARRGIETLAQLISSC